MQVTDSQDMGRSAEPVGLGVRINRLRRYLVGYCICSNQVEDDLPHQTLSVARSEGKRPKARCTTPPVSALSEGECPCHRGPNPLLLVLVGPPNS